MFQTFQITAKTFGIKTFNEEPKRPRKNSFIELSNKDQKRSYFKKNQKFESELKFDEDIFFFDFK